MYPNARIVISPDGSSHKIEGMEKSDQCFKLSELAKKAGKITEDKEKDHPPVYQDVHGIKKI